MYEITMVTLLDGNQNIGGHVRSNLCLLISLRHSIRSESSHKSDPIVRPIFLRACAKCAELPSDIRRMEITVGELRAGLEMDSSTQYQTYPETSGADPFFLGAKLLYASHSVTQSLTCLALNPTK